MNCVLWCSKVIQMLIVWAHTIHHQGLNIHTPVFMFIYIDEQFLNWKCYTISTNGLKIIKLWPLPFNVQIQSVTGLRFSRMFWKYSTYVWAIPILKWRGDKNCNSVKSKVKQTPKDFVKSGVSSIWKWAWSMKLYLINKLCDKNNHK